ncbi:MAG: IMPACT family protein [Saccharofermentanales bacterium]|jgi:uncharacterized YigZ family protein|nr:YigZ family protein [Bacillota bacterium]
MRDSYRSLKQEGRSGYTDRKSEFIGIAKPVETGAEAEEFVAAVRAEFPDARHHVYAWITGGDEVLQKYSDDGEPRGTGGLPVLDVLLHQNLEDAAVVVVRYFGGILLGTGGLVRAYSSAAAQAVEAAVPIFRQKLRIYKLITPYTFADKLRYQLAESGFWQSEPDFLLDVEWEAGAPSDRSGELIELVQDITAGAALIEPVRSDFISRPDPL